MLIHRHDRVQAQSLIEDVLHIGAILELGKGYVGLWVTSRISAEVSDDGGAELLEDIGSTGEVVEDPAKEGGGGIAASEEDVQELGAKLNGIAGLGCERVEEDIAAFLLVEVRGLRVIALLRLKWLVVLPEGSGDEVIDKGVDIFDVAAKLERVHKPIQMKYSSTKS